MKLVWQFFVLITTLISSDSIFNFLKRVTDGSFLFLCETLGFSFYPSWIWALNLGVPKIGYWPQFGSRLALDISQKYLNYFDKSYHVLFQLRGSGKNLLLVLSKLVRIN